MIIAKFFMTRDDGVNLYRRIDALVNENNEPIDETGRVLKDEEELVPTGYKIHKIGTEEYYDEAIDVENTPFKYEETTIPIEQPEEPIEEAVEESIN
jgi:hypothetical protein